MVQSFAEALSLVPQSQGLAATFARAFDYACAQSHRTVTLEHLLLALTEDQDAAAVLAASQVDIGRLAADVSGHLGRLEDRLAPGQPAAPAADPDLVRILDSAAAAARQSRRRELNGAIVLAAIVGDGKSTSAHILKVQGLTFEAAIKALQRGIAAPEPPAERGPAPPHQQAAQPRRAAGSQSTDEILATIRRRIDAGRGGAPAAPEPGTQASAKPPKLPAPRPHPELLQEAHRDAAAMIDSARYADDLPPPHPEAAAWPVPPEGFSPNGADGPDRGWAPPRQSGPQPSAARPIRRPPPLPALMPAGLPPSPMSQVAAGVAAAYPQDGPAPSAMGYAAAAPWAEEGAAGPMGYGAAPPEASYRPEQAAAGAPYPPSYRASEAAQRAPAVQQRVPRPQAGPAQPRASLEPGQLIETIPRVMRAWVPVSVEVRIAKSVIRDIGGAQQAAGQSYRHDLIVTKAMAIRLRCTDGGCFVEPAAPETQWIDSAGGFLSEDDACWRWQVMPRRRGRSRFQLSLAARTVGIDGLTAETLLPDELISVSVRPNMERIAVRCGWLVLAAVAGGAITFFGAGHVWPMLALLPGLVGW